MRLNYGVVVMLNERVNNYITFVRFGACASRVLQGFKTNLVTVNDSLKHHNTTSTRRTRKNAGIERSKKTNKQTKQEQTSNNQMNRLTRKERKKRKKEKRKATSWKKRRRKKKENKKQEQTSNRKEKKKEKKTGNVSGLLIHVTSISLCYLN